MECFTNSWETNSKNVTNNYLLSENNEEKQNN